MNLTSGILGKALLTFRFTSTPGEALGRGTLPYAKEYMLGLPALSRDLGVVGRRWKGVRALHLDLDKVKPGWLQTKFWTEGWLNMACIKENWAMIPLDEDWALHALFLGLITYGRNMGIRHPRWSTTTTTVGWLLLTDGKRAGGARASSQLSGTCVDNERTSVVDWLGSMSCNSTYENRWKYWQ